MDPVSIDPIQTDDALDNLVSLLEESDPSGVTDMVDIQALLEVRSNTECESSIPMSVFECKSDRFPTLSENLNLATFVNCVTNYIKKMHKHKGGNLYHQELSVLRSLCAQHSLTIKQADKGGNIIIMSNMQYKTMCLKILHNEAWYKKITRNTIDKFYQAFYSLVDDTFSRASSTRVYGNLFILSTPGFPLCTAYQKSINRLLPLPEDPSSLVEGALLII